MLRNIFVVLGMVFCFCVSCDKEDNDVKAVENMRDWYKVEDKPGEVNHLLYKMYKYYDVTIFINDTLGQEERGVDAYGEPIVHTELFDMGYYVYGTYTDGRMTLSADSAAMIVAINMIEDRVIPHLPEPGAYRPHSFLLADSVFLTQQIGFSYVTYETDIYSRGIRGMVIGKLNAIKKMSEDELKWFGGEILAVKCADWIQEFCVDELLDFYKISGDSNYDEASMFAPQIVRKNLDLSNGWKWRFHPVIGLRPLLRNKTFGITSRLFTPIGGKRRGSTSCIVIIRI